MRHTLFPIALLALSGVAASDQPHEGSWKDAKVTDIMAYTAGGHEGKGYVVVTFAANGTGTPNCASGYPRSVVIDLSTPGGAYAAPQRIASHASSIEPMQQILMRVRIETGVLA